MPLIINALVISVAERLVIGIALAGLYAIGSARNALFRAFHPSPEDQLNAPRRDNHPVFGYVGLPQPFTTVLASCLCFHLPSEIKITWPNTGLPPCPMHKAHALHGGKFNVRGNCYHLRLRTRSVRE